MNQRRICWMIALSLLVMLLLTACQSTVGTTMTLSESFSGQRDIVCTLNGSLANSQENVLQEIITNHCPAELTPVMGEAGGKKTATFTLIFTSEEEYIQKLEAILGRKPAVSLRRIDTIFCRGITYSEDFSSKDLLDWFDKAAVDAGLIKEGGSIWQMEKPRLTFGGKTYTSKSDVLEITDMVSYPVEKITVNTLLNKEGQFDRTITISIPKSTVDALGSGLTAYLNGLAPDGTMKDSQSGKEFVVTVAAATADELSARTATVLDSEHSQSRMETDSAATTQFIEQNILTETLDFSSFNNENGKVYVNYLFSTEAPYDFVSAQIKEEGAWVDAPGFDPTVGYILQDEVSELDVQLTFRKQVALTDVLLYTEKIDNDRYLRTVTLQFDPAKGLEGPQAIQSYWHDKGFEGTALATGEDGSNTVTLTIQGSVQDISSAMASLFGEGNSLTHITGGGFFAFVQTVDWTETIDMNTFLREAGYAGTVKYTLAANFDTIKEAKIQIGGDEPVTERIGGEFNTSFAPDSVVSLTFSGSQTNTVLLIVVAVLALAVILALIVLLSKWMGRSGKEKKRKLPFGRNIPILPSGKADNAETYPADHVTQRTDGPLQYADVDTDAETETILLEESEGEREEIPIEAKKRKRKNQYAEAKQILAETNVFGGGPKGKSTRKYLKEEKKRLKTENQIPTEPAAPPVNVLTAPAPTSVKPCSSCGKPLRRDARFCTFCGTETEKVSAPVQKFCLVCGNELDKKYAFCSKCGTKMD